VAESSRLPWRTIAASTVIAMLAAGATVVLLSDDADTDDGATTAITLVPEDEVPTFDEATYTTFDGDEVPLSSVRGTPTVVNFFSSTCTPCITEMPAFEEVYQELKEGGQIDFLGLAVADRTDDAMALVDQTGVTYPTAEDNDASVITSLGGDGLPTTVLLDADGHIVSRHTGALSADELRALLAEDLGVSP
jgi:thiol-disulfide isomerase/thioredoxin